MLQNQLVIFNLILHKSFINWITVSTVQLIFKQLLLNDFWYNIKLQYPWDQNLVK